MIEKENQKRKEWRKSNYLLRIKIGNEKKINIDINTVNGDSSKEAYIVNNVIVYKEEREITKIDKIICDYFYDLSLKIHHKYKHLISGCKE